MRAQRLKALTPEQYCRDCCRRRGRCLGSCPLDKAVEGSKNKSKEEMEYKNENK